MHIAEIVWLGNVVDKLRWKHGVELYEVEEALKRSPKIRFIEKGDREDENVFMALGQTETGRYLTILFIQKPIDKALILSARDMAPKERRRYGRK